LGLGLPSRPRVVRSGFPDLWLSDVPFEDLCVNFADPFLCVTECDDDTFEVLADERFAVATFLLRVRGRCLRPWAPEQRLEGRGLRSLRWRWRRRRRFGRSLRGRRRP
jgi:hypothetical protein